MHRDVKPDNVLLTSADGTLCARIADLGIAKSFERAGLSGMTVTGTCCGTFPFMPREQLTNFRYVKPATDVWGAGATLYYVLTGECPRSMAKGEDPMMVVLSRHAVPIRERNRDIPEDLAAIVDQSLATDLTDRFEDPEAMRQALLTTAWGGPRRWPLGQTLVVSIDRKTLTDESSLRAWKSRFLAKTVPRMRGSTTGRVSRHVPGTP